MRNRVNRVATPNFAIPPKLQYIAGMTEQVPITTANKGWFQQGNPGRPQGSTNHLTKTVKETVLAVFNEIQDDPEVKLSAFAKKYPRDFYAIAAKLIPTEITGSLKQVILVTDLDE